MNTTADKKIEISIERDCILIEASKLSLNDDFMSYEPRTEEEKEFKTILVEAIKNGIEDFYRPVMDPSFSDNEKTKIHYMAAEEPAVGKSFNWWAEIVKDTEWEIGSKYEYIVFLGVLIKMLVAKGWTVGEAWNAICNDSKKLGHYWNSDNAKHQFEDTGLREICGFFDLANTYKILAEDEAVGGLWLAGGGCYDDGDGNPLAGLGLCNIYDCYHVDGVAWLVCKKKEI